MPHSSGTHCEDIQGNTTGTGEHLQQLNHTRITEEIRERAWSSSRF